MSFFEFKKNNQNQINIQQIINFIYSKNFNDILIQEKSKFLKNIEAQLINILKRQNKNSKSDYNIQFSLYQKEKENIISQYEKDYSLLKKELNKYHQNPNEIHFLSNFRKHCIDISQIPLHKCSENNLGKFIEVFEENKRKYLQKKSIDKSLYVICSECNKCYNINLIRMYCTCCKAEYYSSKLDENDNDNILPATWKEYHCKPIIVNETMKCIKCENVLYINLYNGKLVCLNIKCNFSSDAKSIIWKCKLCQKDFTSEAKIFNPLDNKILQNSVFECLLNKEISLPQKLYCCCLIRHNTKYFHNRKCDGELYKGSLDSKSIVVCSKCHAVNYYEKFIWICPLCNIKFYYNGKKYKKEITNIKSTKTFFSLEKYQNLNNDINSITKAQRNLSSNIRLFIHNFDGKNKMTLENEANVGNNLYNKNTYDNTKKCLEEKNEEENLNLKGFISKYKYLRKKKCMRYRTLYDILKEKKNQRNKSINELKYNITEEISDASFQYGIKNKKLDEDKAQTASKKIKDRKKIIQNYIYKNDIVVNININSNNIKNTDNLINISNISNSDKIINKKNVFEKIEETENENNIYEYESIRKNLHKKFQNNLNNNENNSKNFEYNFIPNNNNIRNSIHKDKTRDISNERYKLIYNIRSTINEKEKEKNENKIDKRESAFHKKNIRNKFFNEENKNKNNTLNIKTEDNTTNKTVEKKFFYRKFWHKENNKPEEKSQNNNNVRISLKNTNETKIYNSSRLKSNKFHKKLFSDRHQQNDNNNAILNDIPEYIDNSIPISPLGDIGSSLISKEDFLKISKECTIPTFDENNIAYIRPIGQGAFGVIYLVEEKNNKKNQYALKSILCNDLEQILKHKKEFELSYSLSHNNFIKIYNALFKYLDMTTYMLYILMELGESDWATEIEKRAKLNNYYTEKELINILKQLVDVLSFFEKKNIAHRDIKPKNILIFRNNVYKITDLGEAKGAKNYAELATLKGSQFFMSPNLFFSFKYKGNSTKVIHNIYKSDVFSLGYCFLYAMNLNMKLIQNLREENNMINVMNIVKKFGSCNKYSEKFMNIIYKMIEIDENKRWDFIELFNEINKIF